MGDGERKGKMGERNSKSGGSQALYFSLLFQDFVGRDHVRIDCICKLAR